MLQMDWFIKKFSRTLKRSTLKFDEELHKCHIWDYNESNVNNVNLEYKLRHYMSCVISRFIEFFCCYISIRNKIASIQNKFTPSYMMIFLLLYHIFFNIRLSSSLHESANSHVYEQYFTGGIRSVNSIVIIWNIFFHLTSLWWHIEKEMLLPFPL
jgi:hypothetical protein